MKKLLSCLLIVLVITLMFSFAFAKTLKDVEGTKYEASVNLLQELGIVDGYQDGTYKPNNTVSRAELAKLIIVSLGRESAADSLKGSTDYSDVAANSWASGYINCCNSLGIIKGYPDGTFKPNNTVTYAEAATMLLRALNYTKELENEKWPTGYMQIASDAGILDNVTANNSSEAAIRGNITLMVVNMLSGNVRKIVSTSSTGKATYGDGEPLIEQKFKNYVSVRDGEVIDIDFEDREIVVKDKIQNRKVRVIVEDNTNLAKLYTRRVKFLYNDKEDELFTFEILDKYTVDEVEVDEVSKKTLVDEDGEEYSMPSDYIFAYVSNFDEVETAYIIYNGKKINGMVLEGTPKVYAGIVTDNGITVNKQKGFEILKTDGKYDEVAYASSSSKVSNNQVVLYTLDDEDCAMVRESVSKKDCIGIEKLTATSIKLNKKSEISLTNEVEHYVYLVDSRNNISEGKLKDIDQEFDTAYTFKFAEVFFIVVFEDSVDDDDIVSKLSVSEAKEELKDAISAANKLLKKESSYSVATYEALKDAVDQGNAAYKSSSSAAKMELATRRINDAKADLKSASSSDKQLRSDYSDLQSIIKEAEGKKEADYTAASYKKLTDELKNAKAVKLATTTSAKISDRITALRKAINELVTNTANDQIQKAISSLNALINEGNNIVKNKANYTSESYKIFESALTTAKNFKTANASLSEIKTQASNLEAAIDQLVPVLLGSYKTARTNLDNKYKEANNVKAIDYTQDSYEEFSELFATIKTEYAKLKTVSEVEELSNSEVQTELTKVNKLTTDLSTAMGKLVADTVRANLRKYVDKGETYTASTWKNTDITFDQLKTYLNTAKTVLNNVESTKEELKAQINILSEYISL